MTEILIHSARIVAGERVAIVGLLIALIAMLSYRENRKSSKWLFIAIITNIIHLIGDSEAFAYDLGANIPYNLAWVFYFISYIFGYLIMIPFSMYVKSYIEEKTTINKWIFRFPILMEIVATVMVVAAILSGNVFGNVDGRVAVIGGAPAPSTILSIVVIIYVFIAAMTKVKQIGLKAAMLLGMFGLVPAAVIIINYDYSIMCGGLAVLVVFVLLQGDTSAEKEKQRKELEILNAQLEEKQAQLEEASAEQEAQLEEISALNDQLQENQVQLEEAAEEQKAQLEEIQKLYTQKEYLSYSCKMVYPEVYIVDLRNNTYSELETDGFSVAECGDYLAAIEEHIHSGRIDNTEADKIRQFLSPENIYQSLSEKKSIEMRYRRTLRDGRGQWCLTTFVACEMENDHPTVALMLIQNIDEVIAEEEHQKALLEENQERLAEAVENARRANKAKSEFLSRMSHDIRTPMNVIVGMTEIAKRHFEDPAKVADCLDKINMESVHLQTLINDVLDISAIESGKLTIKPEDTRLKDIVDNMDVSVRSLVISKSIDYQYKQGNIFFPYIKADSLRVSQIYLNLLSNAVKYTPAGGKVMFELWQEMDEKPGRVKLCAKISDTGMGMSEEFMQNMYSEFSRAEDTRVNKIQGTGLGLAIVKQLVDLMDGTIAVQSKLGEGTCFEVTLTFDYVEKTDAMMEQDTQQEDFSALEGLKVLIAEDNDLNYEIAYELLSDCGFVISRAVDGAVAFEMVDSAEPGTYDLILMDMQMPVMDGLEATKAIREINREDAKTMPIIAMTANAYVEDALACRQAGMNDHVSKPINVGLLMKVIMEHMKSTLDKRAKRQKADEEIRSIDAVVRNYTVLRNSKVARNMPGGFFAYSAQGDEQLIYANEKACEIWGCRDFQELLTYTGGSFRGMVHPGDLEKTEASIWEQINSGSNDMDSVTYRIIRKDGEIRWLADYGQLVRDEVNGDVFYVFVSDVTSKKS